MFAWSQAKRQLTVPVIPNDGLFSRNRHINTYHIYVSYATSMFVSLGWSSKLTWLKKIKIIKEEILNPSNLDLNKVRRDQILSWKGSQEDELSQKSNFKP